MSEERVFLRVTPENMLTVGLLSAVAFLVFAGARRIIALAMPPSPPVKQEPQVRQSPPDNGGQ